MKARMNKERPELPARSLVIVKITEVFECKTRTNSRCETYLKIISSLTFYQKNFRVSVLPAVPGA